MAHLFPCPACGHKHRVSDNLVGRKVKCTACDAVFRLSPGQALAEPPPAAKAAEAGWGTRLLHKVMDDPSAALDGAIAGAIGGVLAGVVVAVPAGIVSGEAAGETVVRVLLGFVLGIG